MEKNFRFIRDRSRVLGMTNTGDTENDLRQVLTGNVRAALARERVTSGMVAECLGVSKPWVYRRLRGDTPWSVEDLVHLAETFGLDYEDMWRGVPGVHHA